ncbi:hypothetical protein L0Y65_06380 [Candidatus Micrarchaeota archaeon]|nr:hypothetical protein [Candidatus Micrarchaeota archaeon]
MDDERARTVSDVLQKADISIDSYEDIFSDFDPSPIEKRLLSEDFIYELRRRHAATGKGEFVVNFTLPKSMRSEKTEALIRKRIKEHFKSRVREIERKAREKADNGSHRLLAGVLLTIALFLFPQLEIVPVLTILSVLIWYSLWSGLENVLEASSSLRRKKAFAEKFMKAEYSFISQEDVLQSMQKLQGQDAPAKPDPQKAVQKQEQKAA